MPHILGRGGGCSHRAAHCRLPAAAAGRGGGPPRNGARARGGELASSTSVRARARHRGQCLMASQANLGAILRPQRGQFRFHSPPSASDVSRVLTMPCRSPAVGRWGRTTRGARPPTPTAARSGPRVRSCTCRGWALIQSRGGVATGGSHRVLRSDDATRRRLPVGADVAGATPPPAAQWAAASASYSNG